MTDKPTLPEHVRLEAQRILDREARCLLDERPGRRTDGRAGRLNMGSQTPDEIAQELFETLNELAGNHAMALFGVAMTLERLDGVELEKRTPGSMNLVGYGDPNSDAGYYWQAWPLDSLPERLGPEGPVIRAIGQQWIVSVATQWNEHYRDRFAAAEGVDPSEIVEPIMGDLTKMRNDIIHHRGIATKGNSGRRERLKWFSPGEEIHPMPAHVVEVMQAYGLVRPAKDFEDPAGPWREVPDENP